jgi:O-antigen ligase
VGTRWSDPRASRDGGQRALFFILAVALALITYSMTPLTNNLDDIKVALLFCLMPIALVAYFALFAGGKAPGGPRAMGFFLLLYVAVMAVSTLHSPHPWTGHYFTGATIASLGGYFAAIGCVRTREDLEGLARLLTWICLGTVVFGLLHRAHIFHFLLEAFFGNREMDYINPGIHGLFYTLDHADSEMMSTVLNRDFFAAYVNMTIPVAISLSIVTGSRLTRYAAAATAVLGAACVYLTMSKNDYVILIAAPSLFYILYRIFSGRKRARLRHWPIWLLGTAIVAATFTFLRWDLFERQLKLFSAEQLSRSIGSRAIIWKGAWDIFLDRPILGGGPGSFRVLFPQYRHPEYFLNDISNLTLDSHNLFLDYLCETGGLGFLAAMGFILCGVALSLRLIASAEDRQLRILQTGLLCGAFAILLASATSPLTKRVVGSAHFFVLFGAMAAGLNVARKRPPRGAEEDKPLSRARQWAGWALAAMAAACFAASAVFGARYFAAGIPNARGLRYLDYYDSAAANPKALEAAAAEFEKSIRLNPTHITNYYKLANAYHLLYVHSNGQEREYLDKAYASYVRLAEYAPDYADLHYNLGLIFENMADQAHEKMQASKEYSEQRVLLLEKVEHLHNAIKEYSEAARQTNKLLIQLALARNLQRLSWLLPTEQMNEYLERTLEIYGKCLQFDPQRKDVREEDPELLATTKAYGMLLEAMDRNEEAADALFQYLLKRPGDTKASDAWARACKDVADKGWIERMLDELIASNPSRVDYRIYRFILLKSLKRYDEAWEEAQRALSLYPGEIRSLLAAGEILIAQNKPSEAWDYLHRAYNTQPDSIYGQRAMELLQKLNEYAIWDKPPADK